MARAVARGTGWGCPRSRESRPAVGEGGVDEGTGSCYTCVMAELRFVRLLGTRAWLEGSTNPESGPVWQCGQLGRRESSAWRVPQGPRGLGWDVSTGLGTDL